MILKTTLSILSLAEWDYAASGFFLSGALNDHSPHGSRAVRWQESTLDLPMDLYRPDPDILLDLWKRADVIHVHDDFKRLNLFAALPERPTVVTYHGSKYRGARARYDGIARARGWLQTAATLDLGPSWLPDCRPDLVPLKREQSTTFTVAHAPTKRGIKGTRVVIEAVKKLDGVELDLIENVPWRECIERKARAHVVIDQFKLGYGCNAIEGWALDLPVIAGGSSEVVAAIGERAPLPFYRCEESASSIASAIRSLKDDPSLYQEYVSRGRSFYHSHHSPAAVASIAARYYQRALVAFYDPLRSPSALVQGGGRHDTRPSVAGTPKMPPKGQRRHGVSLVALRYIGRNRAMQSFTPSGQGTTGIRYEFSSREPVRLVYAPDVEWFLSLQRRRVKLFTRQGGEDGE